MAPEKVLVSDMRINAFTSWKAHSRVKAAVEGTYFYCFHNRQLKLYLCEFLMYYPTYGTGNKHLAEF